jgi:hypothetical protein
MMLVTVSLVGLVAGVQGCGSTESTPADAGTVDATLDQSVAETGARDSGADVLTCADASLDDLQIPDASFGDSGKTSAGCVACLRRQCREDVEVCNADCACRNAMVNLLACLPSATDQARLIGCATNVLTGLPNEAATTMRSIGLCTINRCNDECVPPGLVDAATGGG